MTWLDELTLETVIVHSTDGPSLKGLKAAVHDDGILLREVVSLDADQRTTTSLGGEFFVPREKVWCLQLVGAS